jgi:hypothetical protein
LTTNLAGELCGCGPEDGLQGLLPVACPDEPLFVGDREDNNRQDDEIIV